MVWQVSLIHLVDLSAIVSPGSEPRKHWEGRREVTAKGRKPMWGTGVGNQGLAGPGTPEGPRPQSCVIVGRGAGVFIHPRPLLSLGTPRKDGG